jgi:serine/threonine protein kinase
MKLTDRAMAGLRGILDESVALVVADRFELHERIGQGASGEVHAALDRQTGARVAVKLFRDADASCNARFEREVEALRALSHDTIVEIVAHGVHDGAPYLVTELLEGRTLRDRFRKGRLSVREAVVLAARLAEALSVLHRAGFEHRDLTPSNVFLVANDDAGTVANARLLDFGLVRHEDANAITARGAVVGTPGYLAPERVRGGVSGPPADIFSLGCIVYEALLGAPPFAADTTYTELARVLLEVAPLVREERPEAPPGLEALVARSLAKEPTARPSADALVEAFGTLLRELPASEPEAPIDLGMGILEGAVIAGKYRAERRLGEGGMGIVLAARHVELGTRVAIKVLRDGDPHENRLLREAQAMARLECEHVARVLDVGRTSEGPHGRPFIIMEHLRGTDLAKYLAERGTLPITEAVDHVLEACVAIVEAHGLGIVHRDLKPSNLFLVERRDGSHQVKVLDFGISKLTRPLEGAKTSSTATVGNVVLGSIAYMSPEQLESSSNVTEQSDIWSLGVVLFELVSGARPFEGESAFAIAARIAASSPRSVSEIVSQASHRAPAALEAVIGQCLEKRASARHRDVAAFAEALRPWAGERGQASLAKIARLAPPGTASARPSDAARASAHAPAPPHALQGTGVSLGYAWPIVTVLAIVGVAAAASFASETRRPDPTSLPTTRPPAAAPSGAEPDASSAPAIPVQPAESASPAPRSAASAQAPSPKVSRAAKKVTLPSLASPSASAKGLEVDLRDPALLGR